MPSEGMPPRSTVQVVWVRPTGRKAGGRKARTRRRVRGQECGVLVSAAAGSASAVAHAAALLQAPAPGLAALGLAGWLGARPGSTATRQRGRFVGKTRPRCSQHQPPAGHSCGSHSVVGHLASTTARCSVGAANTSWQAVACPSAIGPRRRQRGSNFAANTPRRSPQAPRHRSTHPPCPPSPRHCPCTPDRPGCTACPCSSPSGHLTPSGCRPNTSPLFPPHPNDPSQPAPPPTSTPAPAAEATATPAGPGSSRSSSVPGKPDHAPAPNSSRGGWQQQTDTQESSSQPTRSQRRRKQQQQRRRQQQQQQQPPPQRPPLATQPLASRRRSCHHSTAHGTSARCMATGRGRQTYYWVSCGRLRCQPAHAAARNGGRWKPTQQRSCRTPCHPAAGPGASGGAASRASRATAAGQASPSSVSSSNRGAAGGSVGGHLGRLLPSWLS